MIRGTYEAVVAGAGPAGLAIAGALARKGLHVACCDPDPGRVWENNTCAWADDIEPLGLAGHCGHIWPASRIIYGEKTSQLLDRGYAIFDNESLKGRLLHPSVTTVQGRAVRVEHDRKGSDVVLEGGGRLRADVVIDATGHAHALLEVARDADSFQNVYGILARVDRHPFDPGEMVLMDFRHKFLGSRKRPPTFLYAMPYDRELAFFEETSLADSPGVPFEILQGRLYLRLASLGIKVREVESVEVGALPMNQAVPDLDQRVIGFGAAGGFVQPSTGWSVAHSLRTAGPLADCISTALGEGKPPEKIARQAWRMIWTRPLLRMRAFHLRGGEFFGRIGIRTLSLFMRGFFNAPGDMWRVYLSNDCTIAGINRCFLPGGSR
ncbi:MAG: lycopene cyclase family protein [Actinomycetota bacterium]